MSANIIELNGKQYDALTGVLLGAAGGQPRTIPVKLEESNQDVLVAPRHRQQSSVHKKVHVQHVNTPEAATTITVRRNPPHHVTTHKPQHSQTLMRRAVKPPATPLRHNTRLQVPVMHDLGTPNVTIAPKLSVTAVDGRRSKRAGEVGRNQLIRHFDMAAPAQTRHQTASLTTVSGTPSRPAAEPAANPAINISAPTMPKQRSQAIFEHALARADSHKQPPHKAKSVKRPQSHLQNVLSISAATLIIVLIVGFIAYQNAGAIQIRLAASRAGVNATLPQWHPDGFSVGSLSYKPGSVSITFTNPLAAKSFTVTQSATSWDNTALLSDFVMPNSQSFETLQAQNATIYAYGNNNATWVNGAIWYKLTTDGTLSTSQLVKLAASM